MVSKVIEDINLSKDFIKIINKHIRHPMKIMEVCGTHTMSIFKYGIDKLMPPNISLISGPGCPVCVTETNYIDSAINILDSGAIIATFADMLKVPGSSTSLMKEKANGKNVKIIYSPNELIDIALNNEKKEVVFIAVGFETIAPIYADVLLRAKKEKIDNLSFIMAVKRMPPIIEQILTDKDIKINGLLCPGNVCAITGSKPFEKLAKKYKVPMVISGFNSVEILSSILKVSMMAKENTFDCINYYTSVVSREGNSTALEKINDVFEVSNSNWRGLGVVEESGYKLSKSYEKFDALKKFKINLENKEVLNNCLCGSIIKGMKYPIECMYFGKGCTPNNPLGPCMVSNEGTCSNYYKYRRGEI